MNKRLVVFFIPPKKTVNGGVMSIFSLCEESRKFKSIHKSDVVICTFPGYPTYMKNDLFKNNERIYSFDEIVAKYKNLEFLQLHIPELAIDRIVNGLSKYIPYIYGVNDLKVNVMNQNILYMPDIQTISKLCILTDKITQTTAHDRYATQEFCDKFGISLKHLSVFIDKEQYDHTSYNYKKNIIAYSPDAHPMKQPILDKLRTSLPQYELVEIRDLPYKKYKSLIKQCKFVISFGEGFDGYFIESSFSGSIPIAVHNEDFFPSKDFLKFNCVFKSYDQMSKMVVKSIKAIDSPKIYDNMNHQLTNELSQYYSFDIYRNNISEFYRGVFDFEPSEQSSLELLRHGFKNILSTSRTSVIELEEKKRREHYLSLQIRELLHSKSWRITSPLRKMISLKNKLLSRP